VACITGEYPYDIEGESADRELTPSRTPSTGD
jgi:hypothetical protein